MDTALVTGAAGFIGSHLVEELVDCGWTVRGIDNLSTGKRQNLTSVLDAEAFELIEADVRDRDVIRSAVEDVDAVFHQAAVASVPLSFDKPGTTTDVNCLGTTTLLECAHEANVESVVVASSSAVYGSGGELPKHEDMPVSPESPYALSKYYTEQVALQLGERYDIDVTALRYFNVFGPRQDPQGEYAAVIPKFVELMSDGKRPVIYGDGEQSRDFTYIDNVTQANVLAAEGDATGVAVNVGCGDRITITELVERINDVLGTDIEPIYDDPRPGDVRHSMADLERVREQLGYDPEIAFQEGLERTVEWFK